MIVSPTRNWTLVAHLDATSRRLTPVILQDAVSLESVAHGSVAVVADLHHTPCGNKNKAIAETAAAAALPILAGAAALGGFPPAAALAVAAWPLLKASRVEHRLANVEAKAFDAPWSGQRTLDLTARDPQAPLLPIAGPALDPGWLSGFQRYPSQHTAMAFSGHGLAWRKLTGKKPAEVAQMLKETTEKLGHPLDLIVFDTCDTANLEFLRQIAPYARFAIASEGKVRDQGIGLDKVITEGLEQSADPEAAARAVLAHAVTLEKVPTLSLIDLSQVEPLAQAVSKLGTTLQSMPRQQVRDAFRASHQFSFGLTDLPDLLEHLPDTTDAQAALARCVLATTGSDTQAGGITVQGPAAVSVKNYRQNGGLEAWADVLQHIQTWPQKFAGWAS